MKGRILLLVGVCLGFLLLGALFLHFGYRAMWAPWNIPTMSPPFADLRTITGASTSLALGFDPLVNNPGDPWNRRMNYPRVWLLLSEHVDQGATVYLGVALAALFVIGLFLFIPRTLDNTSAIALLICIFSPAVLLGVERGNTDLLIFFLLSITIVASGRHATALRLVPLGSILVAFVLKLFPIFAFPYLLRERGRTLFWSSILLAVLGSAYLILTFHDLSLIRQGTLKSTDLSYGFNVLWMWMKSRSPSLGGSVRILSYVAAAFGLLLACTWLWERNGTYIANGVSHSDQMSIDAFRIGSGIYIGTFLLGNNFDYRLVFLLFTIPQLILWARSTSDNVRLLARIVFGGIIISAWYLVIGRPLSMVPGGESLSFLLDELAKWTVFIGLSCLLVFSAPEWLKNPVNDLGIVRTSRRESLLIFLIVSTALSVSALAYLMVLPSDPSGHLVWRYSAARLVLMTGLVLVTFAFIVLLVKGIRDHQWSLWAADQLYGGRQVVPRLTLFMFTIAVVLYVLVLIIQPDWIERVNPFYLQRLLPYLVLPPFYLAVLSLTGRMLKPKLGST